MKRWMALLCSAALGVAGAQTLDEAKSLLEAGNAKGANTLLKALFESSPGDMEVNFHLGRSAFALGHYDAAIQAFERVLIHDAGHHRARLELARSYAALGMIEEAGAEFDTVLADATIPAEVRQNVQTLRNSLKKPSRLSTTLTASGGVGFDTNINASPGEEELVEYFALTTQADPSKIEADGEEESSYLYEQLDAALRYPLNDALALDVRASLYNQNYAQYSKHDISYGALSLGLAYLAQNYRLLLPLKFDHVRYGKEAYLSSYAFAPELILPLDQTLQAHVTLKHQWREYEQAELSYRDGTATELGAGLQKRFGSLLAGGALMVGSEEGDDPKEGYVARESYGLRGFVQAPLDENIQTGAQLLHKWHLYDRAIPNSQEDREDRYTVAGVWVSRTLGKQTQGRIDYSYITNDSNYVPAEYDKSIVRFGLSYTF